MKIKAPKLFNAKKAVKKVVKDGSGHRPLRAPRTLHLNQPQRAIPKGFKRGKTRTVKITNRDGKETLIDITSVKAAGNKMCVSCRLRARQNGSSRCKGCAKVGHGK